MDVLQALDLAAPYIALAQALGRIGCFLNGCCYGAEAPEHFSLALYSAYDGCMRHPAQLYSAAMLLAIFVILRVWHELRRFKGEVFLGYCMLYSAKRFAVDFLRGDMPKVFLDLTAAQLISAALFLAAAAIFVYRHMTLIWKKS
jgi:phosphatidylglycerol:prolipoprotein diacylglycerol transferase